MEKSMRKDYSWKLDYSVTVGPVYTKFYEGLIEKKILGNKCSSCGRVYVPPRPFCDICFVEPDEWVEMEPRGTVETFTITYQKFENLPEPPYITAVIRMHGSATSLIHFIGGIEFQEPKELPTKVTIGMEVEPVWAEDRKGDIRDIEYFKPVDKKITERSVMGKQKALIIGELLEEKAKKNKDKTYVYYKDSKISYKDVNDMSNRVANGLLQMGVKKGENVCVMLPNIPEFLYTWFGIAKIGAAEVPVNTAYKGDFLRYLIDNCEAKIMVIHSEFVDRLQPIRKDIPKLEKLVIVDGSEIPKMDFTSIKFSELINSPAERPKSEVSEHDTGAIIYTSGTTGNPKGAMLSQGTQINVGIENAKYRDLSSKDIVYSCLPLFHANAQMLTAIPCLIADASYALGERFSPTTFWDDIRKYNATQFNFIGAILTYLIKQPAKENDAGQVTRLALGAPIPKVIYEDFRRRFNIKFLEGFGLTETGIFTYNKYHDPNPKLGSFGKVTDGYEAMIVDENDYEAPHGTVGEIVMRSTRPNMMMSGYYKMPEKTLESFRNLWFHTGDYGFMDNDRYFYFVDRKKDYLRVGGENISSMQVEGTINSHPQIAESAALGVRAEGGEDAMLLFVVTKPNEKLTPEDLMTWAEERLPRFAMPRYIEFIDQLPKTPTERIEKYKLKERGIGPNAWDRVKAGYKLKK